MIIIDSNIILRFVLNDEPNLSLKAKQILSKIQSGNTKAYLSPIILAEIVYVLLKVYKIERKMISQKLLPILALEDIFIENKVIIPNTFEVFVNKNVDFEDAFLVALMEKRRIKEIYSFDGDFDKFPQIKRLEK